MPKGQPFSPEVKAKSIALVQELVKTGAAPSTWAALVQVARDLKCSPETVRVWCTKPPATRRRGRPAKVLGATPAAAPVQAAPVAAPVLSKPATLRLQVARAMLEGAVAILAEIT